MSPIIKSLLDNDLYKFTMLQAFCHFEEKTEAKYTFRCRTSDICFENCIDRINYEVDALCELTFTADELEYLSGFSFIKPAFIEFLKNFKFKRDHINIELNDAKQLQVDIQGPIVYTSLFEIPLLAIINEVYFTDKVIESEAWEIGNSRLDEKINFLKFTGKDIPFSDFGTRRRFSFEWHDNVINKIVKSKYNGFIGTSNLYFAKKYNLRPIGTMAHEWIMAHAGVTSLEKGTSLALKRWLDFYNGELGIALTDTFTTDYFLTEFEKTLAVQYSGVRHDSGDWKDWGCKIIEKYESHDINPLDKTLVFSDGLDFETIADIYEEFHDKVKLMFGIGTDLTNDVGVVPVQIVIKMVEAAGLPVIKVSDTVGKIICTDKQYMHNVINFLKQFNRGRLSHAGISYS
jgi:nicotinate phosphoribosyltransferase